MHKKISQAKAVNDAAASRSNAAASATPHVRNSFVVISICFLVNKLSRKAKFAKRAEWFDMKVLFCCGIL